MNDSLQSIDVSSLNDDMIEEWTVDRDTAFEIGWNLTIVKKIQNLFLKELNKQKQNNEYQFSSIRFPIDKEIQKLIYFPVYIIDYQYRNRQLQCLINGQSGQVAGLRQFSRLKVRLNFIKKLNTLLFYSLQVMAVIIGIIYPACLMSFVSISSFVFYAITRRFIIIPFTLLFTAVTFPFITIAALQIGRYIRDYSHLYRGKRDIREWIDFKKQNPYFFTEKNFDQRDAPPIFDRQRTKETR